jgi:hypothetical protein
MVLDAAAAVWQLTCLCAADGMEVQDGRLAGRTMQAPEHAPLTHHTHPTRPPHQVPFSLLATAYRRKRIMTGLISGDKEVVAQVVAMAEEAAQREAEARASTAGAAAGECGAVQRRGCCSG